MRISFDWRGLVVRLLCREFVQHLYEFVCYKLLGVSSEQEIIMVEIEISYLMPSVPDVSWKAVIEPNGILKQYLYIKK